MMGRTKERSAPPVRRPFLQKRHHAFAGLLGDEQPRGLLAQLVRLAVERFQNGSRSQGFGGGQPLGRRLADRGGQRRHGGFDVVGGDGDQPDIGGLGRGEFFPRAGVETRGGGGVLREAGGRK